MNWNWKSAVRHLMFIKNKPLVFLRIINGFFKKIILKRDVLRTIDLAVTYECHYQCKYCSAFLMKREGKKVLMPAEIGNMWQEALKLGVIHVNLTGGEPFTRDIDELCEIVSNLTPHKILVSVVTNSTVVTRDKLEKLRDAGLDNISLSIESMNPEVNDRMRGVPGALEKTKQVLKWAKELGLNICLSAVIGHDNKKEIQGLLDFAKKEGIFLLLNPASSVGKWRGKNEMKMLEEDRKTFENFMRDKYVRSDSSFNFSGKRGCPGGQERIHITAYGDVQSCPLVQVSYGNILREPLVAIFTRMNSLPFIKKYSPVCKQSFDKEYYEKICRPAEESKEPPLSIFEHPNVKID